MGDVEGSRFVGFGLCGVGGGSWRVDFRWCGVILELGGL